MVNLSSQDRQFLDMLLEKKAIQPSVVNQCIEVMYNHQQHGVKDISFADVCIDLQIITQEQRQMVWELIRHEKPQSTNATQIQNNISRDVKPIPIKKAPHLKRRDNFFKIECVLDTLLSSINIKYWVKSDAEEWESFTKELIKICKEKWL